MFKHLIIKHAPQIFGSLLTLGHVATGIFQKKNATQCLEALNFWVHCHSLVFFQKNGTPFLGSPQLVGMLPQALFFLEKMLIDLGVIEEARQSRSEKSRSH